MFSKNVFGVYIETFFHLSIPEQTEKQKNKQKKKHKHLGFLRGFVNRKYLDLEFPVTSCPAGGVVTSVTQQLRSSAEI